MMEQRDKFSFHGLRTEFVGEGQTDRSVEKRVINGDYQLVFITPECIINSPKFRKMLLTPAYKDNLEALVVDEAHCVKLWGDKFRDAFSKIGDLRSLLPANVRIMALTATATNASFKVICDRLCLQSPSVIALPPTRDNIMYQVLPKITIEDLTTTLCKELRAERATFPKTVMFVRSCADCSNLYKFIRAKLGPDFTVPSGYPDHYKFRMVEMFTRICTINKKEQILISFKSAESPLRLIIATIAFGLGIDCRDIEKIIHWGIPSNVEEYVQETGRVGRDGRESVVVLYEGRGGRHAGKEIKHYIANKTVCRRKVLFADFLNYVESDTSVKGCKCCDICAKKCDCDQCTVAA